MSKVDIDRGSGRTTRQIQLAPRRAIFVWCNADKSYIGSLATNLDRGDLTFVAPEFLEYRDKWRGRDDISDIVVDHAASLTHRQSNGLLEIRAYLGRHRST